MKNSKLKIILIAFTVIFTVTLSGGYYYLSKKISPNEIRKITLEQLQKVFPRAVIELGHIKPSFGFSVKLTASKFKMKTSYKKNSLPLLEVENLNVSIPVWSILMGGGKINIEMISPRLSYHEFGKTNNWEHVAPKQKKLAKKKKRAKKQKEHGVKIPEASGIALPAFLAGSKVNLLIKDVNVDYKLKDGRSGQVEIQRFKVNDLGLKGNAGYELLSEVKLSLDKTNQVSFKGQVIGDFNLNDFLGSGELKSNLVVNINELKATSLKKSLPKMVYKLEFLLKTNGDISGKLKGELGFAAFGLNYEINKRGVVLTEIDKTIDLTLMTNLLRFENEQLKFGDSKFKLKGDFRISSKGKISPSITFSLGDGVVVNTEGIELLPALDGSLRGKELKVDITNKTLGGEVLLKFRNQLDLNKKMDGFLKMNPVNLLVIIRNINISEAQLQKLLYSKKKEASLPKGSESVTSKKSNIKENSKKEEVPLLLPPMNINLKMENNKIGGESLLANGKFLARGNKFVTEKFKFEFSKGEGELKHSTTISKKKIHNKLDFKLNGLNLDALKAFLPQTLLKGISGSTSGVVSGTLDLVGESTIYSLKVKVNATNGELQGVNISEHVQGIISKIPKLKNKDYKVDGRFDSFQLDGNFSNKVYLIKKYSFVAAEKKAQITGKGTIYPQGKKKGELFADFKDNTGVISLPLEKETGMKIIPIKMVGTGFLLKPDYRYTIKKISKRAVKKQGRSLLKKKGKKFLNKYLKGKDNKQVDKLFKKFGL